MKNFDEYKNGDTDGGKSLWFTVDGNEKLDFTKDPNIKYCIYQLERGKHPTEKNNEGYLHYHMFVIVYNTERFVTMAKRLGLKKFWAGKLKGLEDRIKFMNYCQKDDTRVDGPWCYSDKVRPWIEKYRLPRRDISTMLEPELLKYYIEKKLLELDAWQDYVDGVDTDVEKVTKIDVKKKIRTIKQLMKTDW